MKSVNVRYFAALREQAGVENESVSGDFTTYADLYTLLMGKHGFTLPRAMIQVAVNDEFSQLSSPVVEGVRVVFLPPMAGG